MTDEQTKAALEQRDCLLAALKALLGWEEAQIEHFNEVGPDDWIMEMARDAVQKALDGRSSTEVKPVAWINWNGLTGKKRLGWECESELASEPLYMHPPTQGVQS